MFRQKKVEAKALLVIACLRVRAVSGVVLPVEVEPRQVGPRFFEDCHQVFRVFKSKRHRSTNNGDGVLGPPVERLEQWNQLFL